MKFQIFRWTGTSSINGELEVKIIAEPGKFARDNSFHKGFPWFPINQPAPPDPSILTVYVVSFLYKVGPESSYKWMEF